MGLYILYLGSCIPETCIIFTGISRQTGLYMDRIYKPVGNIF